MSVEMAWPVRVTPKSANTPPERSDKDDESSKGENSWNPFSGFWSGKSKTKEEREPEAASAQTVSVREPRAVKTRERLSKRTGDWVVAEYSDKKQQPPNVGEGHTDGDGGSLNALNAALQYNDVVNRKNDQLMKKIVDVKMNSSKKDIEISRLKAQLAGSSETSQSHEAIMRETQTENRMLRTKVADLEIRVKYVSPTDNESQIGAKDTEIDELKEEIEQLKAVAGRFEQMKEHSRGQSKEVLELKVKLQQSEMTQEDTESLQRVVEDLDKENWQLRERLTALNENVELLERDKQQLQVEFGHLQVSTSRLGSLSAENTELRSTLGQMKEYSRGQGKEVLELKVKLQQSEVENERLEREFDAAIDDVKGQLAQTKLDLRTKARPMEREDTELARYRIMSYQPLKGDTFSGAGAFGSVHRVRVSNIPCIAKRIHDILVGRGIEEAVSEVEKHAIQEKFQRECVLLSRMRHPNIVQFMGVHYPDQNPLDLTLIMEFLPMDLEKCLKKYPNLPLPIKLSILLDVSYGLLHLHNASIIHRDFTAANVLLTHDMRAKITDLGVSKILDVHPRQMSKQTATPGALGYMPPEALREVPLYAKKLDIFSFGVLALFVGVQMYPQFYDLEKDEPRDSEQIRKRRKWIQMLPEKGCGCLQRVVVQCLQDEAAHRPTTERLNITLKQLSQDHPRQCTDIVHLEEELARMKLQVKN